MCRIEKIGNFILKNIPKRHKVPIRYFDTTKRMFCEISLKTHCKVDDLIKWYDEFGESVGAAYVVRPFKVDWKVNNPPDRISWVTALAFNPIFVAKDGFKDAPDYYVAWIILHEIGHHYGYKIRRNDEFIAEDFALRWFKYFNNKGYFNVPSSILQTI
jgi:hypothetical protein